MTHTPLTAVGEIVKAELQARGLKARHVARQIGVKPPHLSAILRGHEPLSLAVCLGLERVLGLDAEALLRLDHARALAARLTALQLRRAAHTQAARSEATGKEQEAHTEAAE